MARYEHLPIFRAAFDLALHLEKLVRGFSRYHKYTLGTELRNISRGILDQIVRANSCRDRVRILEDLRLDLERFKVLVRLCHEAGGFASTRSYLHVSERVVEIARQNEGWLRHSRRGDEAVSNARSGAAGKGRNRQG